ncbi:MAG: ATP-binding SpoIIE family protein phosphatase [Solirubrobacteraceae bacterium]
MLRGEALGRLVEAAPIGIVTLDSTHRILAWNTYAAEILGADEQEVLGTSVFDLFGSGQHAALGELLARTGQPHPGSQPVLLCRPRAGAEQFIEVNSAQVSIGPEEQGHLVILDDVSERVLGDRALRRAEQAQTFLAEAGALLDTSPDPVQTLQRIASLAVPARAELCVIDLLSDTGAIIGVASAAVDPAFAGALEKIRQSYPLDPEGEHPVARVLRSGQAVRLEQMTDETYRRIAHDPEHLALMRGLRYHAALVAPLTARGRTFGAISLLAIDPARRYAAEDLAVLLDVARRAALALDNARLYAREHRIAETLQRSLLPARLPQVPGLRFAARYEPGEGDVGGDWYDVIPLPDGRIGCVVGDIVGRGIDAASVMGQLRNAVRVYALERSSAAEVVKAVDGLAESLGDGRMATLLYTVIDRAGEVIEICSAGHPPALLIDPDGGVRYLASGRSTPVGIGDADRHIGASEPFPDGSALIMYTDGLIERRGETLDCGLARLARAAGEGPADPSRLIAEVLARLGSDERPDDVAVLAIRSVSISHDLRLTVPADPRRVAEIRRSLRHWLESRIEDEELYDVLLASSEACANVVQHAYALRRGAIEVEAELRDGELSILVRDRGRWRTDHVSSRGRGTVVMNAAMDEVRVSTGEAGTEVLLRRRLRAAVAA